jgi:hypothetical protein
MSVSVPKLPVTRHQIRSGELPLIFLKQNWCLESFLARAAHEQEEEVPSAVPLGFNWGAQRRRYLCGHAFDSMEGRRFGTTQKACSSCFLHGVRVRGLGIFLLAVASSGCVLGFGLHVPIAPCALCHPLFDFCSANSRLAVEFHSFRGVLRRLFFHRMVHPSA